MRTFVDVVEVEVVAVEVTSAAASCVLYGVSN